jgi:hypothetical protein
MGCNTSKPAKQAGSKPGRNQSSPQKGGEPARRHGAPFLARPSPTIKTIAESELKKHKIDAIVGFVKTGNISMVHGLTEYYKLGKGILNVRGDNEEVKVASNDKTTSKDFNPFLIAVAHRRVEIVRYLINDLKISVRMAGKDPRADGPGSAADAADQQIFSLKIAIANRDQAMFDELWNQWHAWESNHLIKIFEILVLEKWQ